MNIKLMKLLKKFFKKIINLISLNNQQFKNNHKIDFKNLLWNPYT